MLLFFSPTIKIVGKNKHPCLFIHFFFIFSAVGAVLLQLHQFSPAKLSAHTLQRKNSTLILFSDNTPTLEIGHDTLSNSLILLLLLTNLSLLFPSWIFILHQHPLYYSVLLAQYLFRVAHLQKKYSAHQCTNHPDPHLCSGSASLCSENSLSLTSSSMLGCQIMLNGSKTELISSPRPLHNCIYHQGTVTCPSDFMASLWHL